MRGDFKPNHIPHALKEVASGVFGPKKWQVILRPHDAPEVACDPDPSMSKAYANAEAYIQEHHKGKSL